MTADVINLFQALPQATPHTQQLSSNLQVGQQGLEERQWWTNVLRTVVPGYASKQDTQTTHYFLNFFKEIVTEKRTVPSSFLREVIVLAEQHVGHRIDPAGDRAPKEVADLERYTLAARIRLNHFDSNEHKATLKAAVERHHQSLFTKWDRLDFGARPEDKEAFWTHPDMVDFIFKNHLHRNIRHADYMHKIQMLPVLNQREGRWVVEWEAHLKMNGHATKWSEIRNMLKVDDENRLYSIDAQGHKQHWMYLDEGFVPHERYDMEHMRRFKKLGAAPSSCQIQLITTHAPKNKWHMGDRVLQGTRHTFFRVVFRQNFQRTHAEQPYKDGEVYSIGWGAPWNQYNPWQPLKTLTGKIFCPDSFEFFAEDLYGSNIDITDEQALRVMDVVKRRQREAGNGFHIITSNCTSNTADILREAQILDLSTEEHMLFLWYKFFFPESLRNHLDGIGKFFQTWTPDLVIKGLNSIGYFLHSLIFVPLFTLMGAWRSEIAYDNESASLQPETPDELMLRAGNRVKALFSNGFDLFNSEKMTYDLTFKVWDWQKRFAEQNPERTFFVKQS